MVTVFRPKEYDLAKTLASGQAFRYTLMPDGSYRVISLNRICFVKQLESKITLQVYPERYIEDVDYWVNYFNFDQDISDLLNLVAGNEFLEKVVAYSKGLRMLQQDPWESLVDFIISQQKRIPQIQASIERICELSGKSLGGGLFAFPTPHEILSCSIAPAKLGYREAYILAAAEEIDKGFLNLETLRAPNCSYERCIQRLCAVYGVGLKVANCVALFSLGHIEAFPVDVHIERILALPEMKGFNPKDFGKNAGLIQQYLFKYAIDHNI